MVGYQQTGAVGQPNVRIENISVSANISSAVAAGQLGSLIGRVVGNVFIRNINVTANISGINTVGGLVGTFINVAANRTFDNISVHCSSVKSANSEAGGIIGSITYTANTPSCSNINVTNSTVSGSSYVGGLIGMSVSEIPAATNIIIRNCSISAAKAGAGGLFG